MGRGIRPLRRLGRARLVYPRARKVDVYRRPGLPPVQQVQGLNIPESRIYWALTEMKVRFTAQSNFLGGSILGGARADFVLADYKLVILYQGPFHATSYGFARHLLSDASYNAAGYDVRRVYETDLADLKNRLRQIIGIPLPSGRYGWCDMTVASGSQILASDHLKHNNANGELEMAASTELTIATGAITPTQNFHRVDTEADAASDDLDTITLPSDATDGYLLFLRAENDGRTVVVKHNTGNIMCFGNADITLDDSHDWAVAIYDSNLTKWMALGAEVADNAISNAKLRNSGALSVIGD